MSSALQCILYLALAVAAGVPLGVLISRVMDGKRTFMSPVIRPIEAGVYHVLRIDEAEQMGWKRYLASLVAFSGIGLIFLFGLQMLQHLLPANPAGLPSVPWGLSLNTAISFVTNTNWQAYSGEFTLSYLSQFLGLTVQNFVSAATGMSVMFVLIRGFRQVGDRGLGSFWVDMVRIVLYVLVPVNLVVAIAIAGGGVVANFSAPKYVDLLEPVAVVDDGEGGYEILDGAQIDGDVVMMDGAVVEGARVVDRQFLPQGPAASQVAIKQTGTNGGGFFGANSAHPYENPSAFTNLIETVGILAIPVGCCFAFGIGVKDRKQGRAIFLAMFILLSIFLAVIAFNEQIGTPQLAAGGDVDIELSDTQSGGNMEGKESRFGIASSSTWSAFTTAASNGSVNSAHDSLTPLGGLAAFLQIALGEVIFGGVGCGMYSMIGFSILTVFIAGLMVGRTPEFLGKKIEPCEMRWAVVLCLAAPFAVLVFSAVAAMNPAIVDSLNNAGPHGFSEFLYAYVSGGGNNGSSFAGFDADTVFINVTIGLEMLVARFLPIVGTLAIADSLAGKKRIATTAGTLSTCNGMFIFLLIFIVLLIGALGFFPALALGPVAEFLQMIL
ncbi:MAG: potassium-transporting ATPase subunit KdpA [Collinsella sp.]|nr:potassium-transporting ATPase subunit KdpA [Collinsella sp.]